MSVCMYITLALNKMWASAQTAPQCNITAPLVPAGDTFARAIRLDFSTPAYSKFTVSWDELERKPNF